MSASFFFRRQEQDTGLYSLVPAGIGTWEIQSLSDYLKALALAHMLSLNALVSHVLGLIHLQARTRTAKSGNGRECNGIGQLADQVAQATALATGRSDLRTLTLVPLRNHICGEGLLALQPRYCPLCFQTCPTGTLPHGRLLWCIAEVQCCPLHKVRLRNAKCGRSTRCAPAPSPVLADGVCRVCGAMGYTCVAEAPVPCSQAELWVAEQVAAVIANQADIEAAGVAATKQFVKDYCEEPGRSVLRVATKAGVTSSGLSRFILQPTARLRLHAFLRIAAAEGIALVDLLLGKVSTSASPSQPVAPRARRRQRRAARLPSLRELLVEGLAQQRRFADFAREVDVPERTLRKCFPAECAAMTEQTRALVRERKAEALRHDIVRCEGIADDLLSQGKKITAAQRPTETKLTASEKRVLQCLRGLLEGKPLERGWQSEPERLLLGIAQRLSAKYGLCGTVTGQLTTADNCRWQETTACSVK